MSNNAYDPTDTCNKCLHHEPDRVFAHRLDIGGGSGIYLCRKCWSDEMSWRKYRNHSVANKFDILPFPEA